MRKTRVTNAVLSMLSTRALTTYDGYTTPGIIILNVCLEFGMHIHHIPYYFAGSGTQQVELLIRYGADVNCDDGYLIRAAAWENNIDTVILLIKAGADVNLCGMYMPAMSAALMLASHFVVEQLLLAGAHLPGGALCLTLPGGALALAQSSKIDSALKVQCVIALAGNQG